KADLEGLGGLSKATAGVILRELITLQDQGAEAFFGEPEFQASELVQVAADGRGTISLVELPNLQDRPAIFSTFLMWLLADLFHDLPEVGDVDRPKLVFFFDEAHLLFSDASKAFLEAITRTVRLVRSKGIGVFFVTQTPKDVPAEVLAQLGNRVQHALRAFTPDDAKALKATVSTFPTSETYDLKALLPSLGIGEAVVTVLSDSGVPTPVVWTRLRPPASMMAALDPAAAAALVAASPLLAEYGAAIDRESAYERLTARVVAAPTGPADAPEPQPSPQAEPEQRRQAAPDKSVVQEVLGSSAFRSFARSAGREITRSLFGTARRRRR
ncbi:MAG: ATPase, partial [Frankiales bacterium]|nr:ATPase [Frankiales bacterium]